MQNSLKLIAIVIIIAATANLTFGSSALIEQVVNAQNMTENNNTDDNSTNESGIISSLPMPIRPPYVSD
jgi:FlaG/FlaF family flagellin (archaellin)